MGEAIRTTGKMHGVAVHALTVLVAVAVATGMCGVLGSGRAFASDGPSRLQTASCGVALTTKVVKKKPLSNQEVLITMAGGDVTMLKAKPTGSKVKWASSNAKAVKAQQTGKYSVKIIAKKPGKAIVTATRDGKTLTCRIVVTGALNKTKVTLTPFATAKLRLKGAAAKKWSSSDKDVVRVAKGKVTPIATGSATITCVDKKGCKYTCAVTVQCPAITCKMSPSAIMPIDSQPYYCKRFDLSNKSGKSLVLDDHLVYYHPEGIGSSRCVLSVFDPGSDAYLSSAPVTVANAQDYSFWGADDAFSPVTEKGIFSLAFKVEDIRYRGVFCSSGEMVACLRK